MSQLNLPQLSLVKVYMSLCPLVPTLTSWVQRVFTQEPGAQGGFLSITITTVSWGPMATGLLGLTILSKHFRM